MGLSTAVDLFVIHTRPNLDANTRDKSCRIMSARRGVFYRPII